jgi:hypothetical protein
MLRSMQPGPRGVAWTTHGQNPCDFRPGPGCFGGSGYRASFRTDVPLGRCPRHTPFGPCWRFSVFSLSTSTLWAKAGVPVLRLRSSVSRDCGVGWKGAGSPDGTKLLPAEPGSAAVDARRSRAGGGVPPRSPARPFFPHWVVLSHESASLRRLVNRYRLTLPFVRMLVSQLSFRSHVRCFRSVVGPLCGRHNSEAPSAIRAAAF